jgi:predicted HD phosphohydrolase
MRAQFREMSESTKEDWTIIGRESMSALTGLPDRILAHLQLLGGDYGGFPVDRLQHCLQTAALAAEAGEDEEYIVCALLHDVGDTLGSANHADVSATILEPFVSDENHWMVKHHAIFQGYNFFHHIGLDRDMRDRFKGTENYDRTEAFIRNYDDPAFDADKALISLEPFVPMVKSVFSTPKKSIYSGFIDA